MDTSWFGLLENQSKCRSGWQILVDLTWWLRAFQLLWDTWQFLGALFIVLVSLLNTFSRMLTICFMEASSIGTQDKLGKLTTLPDFGSNNRTAIFFYNHHTYWEEGQIHPWWGVISKQVESIERLWEVRLWFFGEWGINPMSIASFFLLKENFPWSVLASEKKMMQGVCRRRVRLCSKEEGTLWRGAEEKKEGGETKGNWGRRARSFSGAWKSATTPVRGGFQEESHHWKARKSAITPLREWSPDEWALFWSMKRCNHTIERMKDRQPVAPFSKQGRRIHSVLRFRRHKRHHPHLERKFTSNATSHFHHPRFAAPSWSSPWPPLAIHDSTHQHQRLLLPKISCRLLQLLTCSNPSAASLHEELLLTHAITWSTPSQLIFASQIIHTAATLGSLPPTHLFGWVSYSSLIFLISQYN